MLVFSWTATDKLEFTDWSDVQWRFGSGEIAIFRKRMIITRFEEKMVQSAISVWAGRFCPPLPPLSEMQNYAENIKDYSRILVHSTPFLFDVFLTVKLRLIII